MATTATKDPNTESFKSFASTRFKLANYKPKLYYEIPNDEFQLEKELQSQEDGLRQYRYGQELDRLGMEQNVGMRWENIMEDNVYLSMLFGLCYGRIFGIATYKQMYNSRIFYLMAFKGSLGCYVAFTLVGLFHPSMQVQNHHQFKMLAPQVRLYRDLSYRYDMYQDTEKIKYNMQIPSKWEIEEVYDKANIRNYEDLARFEAQNYYLPKLQEQHQKRKEILNFLK